MTVLITAPNLAHVTQAIVDQLKTWDALADMAVPIERSERVPDDPSRTPWIGVYRIGVSYGEAPRAMGFGHGMRRWTANFAIVVQEADQSSGAECEDRIERLLSEIASALLSDPSLGGRADVLESFSIDYEFVPTNSGFFQQAVLRFAAVGMTAARTV